MNIRRLLTFSFLFLWCTMFLRATTEDELVTDFAWSETDCTVTIAVGETHQLSFTCTQNADKVFLESMKENWVYYDLNSSTQQVIDTPEGYSVSETGVITGLKPGKYAMKPTGLILKATGTDGWLYINVTYTNDPLNIISSNTAKASVSFSTTGSYEWIYDAVNNRLQSSNYNVNSSTSATTITITSPVKTKLSFDYAVSSESRYDKLTIKFNGSTIVNAISGSTSGNYESAELPSGTYTLVLSYSKDSSSKSGDDRGYLSNLVIDKVRTYWLGGDVDGDDSLSVGDVTSLADILLIGNEETQTLTLRPNAMANEQLQGSWISQDAGKATFSETNSSFLSSGTFKYLPYPQRILLFASDNTLAKVLKVKEMGDNYLILSEYGSNESETYYKGNYISSISLSETKITGAVGTSCQLVATLSPADAAIKQLSWTSSDVAVATVDQNGLVTIVGDGTAIITASATDGTGLMATCDVSNLTGVQSITLSSTSLTMAVDDEATLTATILPAGADAQVTWSSSDEDVVYVDKNGNLYAMDCGEATITCAATDGSGVTATCKVIVTE